MLVHKYWLNNVTQILYLEDYYILNSTVVQPTMSTTPQTKASEQTVIPNEVSLVQQPFIGHYEAAPAYMKENDKIRSGYRINFQSKKSLFKTLFMIHNESINIWTHLLPFLVFACVMISFWMTFDDVDFKRTVSQSRQQLDRVYREYQLTLANASFVQTTPPLEYFSESLDHNLFQKYHQIIHKITLQTTYLHDLLSKDIQGLGQKFKAEVKEKLHKLQEYKQHYEQHIMPELMEKIDKGINTSPFLLKVKHHAEELKQYLDSQLFEMIELHPETPNPQLISRWPLFVFMVTAVLCLLFSTIFHLFHPLSRKAFGLLLRFDFAGISLLIAGSAYPTFYYSLYCNFPAVEFYLTATSVLALICFVIGLFQWIHLKQNAKYRGFLFGAFGLSMIIPLTHLVINQYFFDNYGDPYRFSSSYFYYGALISSYVIGLYIFIVKWPECNAPGKYDICGHSHQIWHCLVVLGIIFTYYGCLNNYEMRKQAACPLLPS